MEATVEGRWTLQERYLADRIALLARCICGAEEYYELFSFRASGRRCLECGRKLVWDQTTKATRGDGGPILPVKPPRDRRK